MRMKDSSAEQFLVLPDHFKNNLHILAIADAHGVIGASLYGVEQQITAFLRGINQLHLLSAQDDKGKNADAES